MSKLSDIQDKVINILKNNVNAFNNTDDLTISEIGDGNVNYVFRIINSKTGFSVIAKYADSYFRGSKREISTKRSDIENFILTFQYQLTNGLVPNVYHYDKKSHCIIMEDLNDYKTLRTSMINRDINAGMGKSLGQFLYKTLFLTTDLVLQPDSKKENVSLLINKEMCEISERLVFTEPYLNLQKRNSFHQNNIEFIDVEVYKNIELHLEVSYLKDRFKNLSQSMIHGDLHTGSVFVKDGDIKVFDPEFSFYGPMGYDIGNLIANLSINYVIENVIHGATSYSDWLKLEIVSMINTFIDTFNDNYHDDITDPMAKNDEFKHDYLQSIMSDSFGYAGTELIRRTVGAFSVPELDMLNNHEKLPVIERLLIRIGQTLIFQREYLTINKLFHEIEKGLKNE